nr:hypothetical protein [Tanacetum cinerariifolium]
MATTIEQQVALDEALVPSTQREMLHICPRIPGQAFAELPFEEEILEFIRFLRHGKPRPTKSTMLVPAPKPKASARRKRSGSDTSITPPTATKTLTTTVAVTPRLTATAKGKQPAKAKSPSDPSEDRDDDEGDERGESDDGEEDDAEDKDGDKRDDDDEEISKIDEQDDTERGRDDDEESESEKESDGEETREEESFDPILRTPEDSEDDGNDKEDQGVRISEEERLNKEEEAEELYKDVNINQGRGIQATLDVEDSHVTLTLVHLDGQQESSSVSLHFMTNMLNPPSDVGMESTFTTTSSSVAPLQTSTPIMTPSTIATITTISHAPIPPTTIPSEVKSQVKEQISRILPRIEQSVNAQLEVKVLTRSSHSSRTLYTVAADLSEMELKKILIEKMEGNKKKDPSLDQTGGLRDEEKVSASESAFAEEPVQTTCQMDEPSYPVFETAVQGSTQTWISELVKQADSRSSFNELLDTPLDFSNFIMNRLRVDTLTPELLAGPTFELMKGSCTRLIKLEYHLEKVYKATTDQLDCVNPEGQQYPHNLLQPLSLILDNRGHHVIPFAHFINNDLEYLRGEPINYDKHSLWGVSCCERKRQQLYEFAVNRESTLDVYSKRRIITVTDLKIVEWHSYKHLDWITRRVEDLQLGVESYQKRLNLTKPDTYRSDLKQREAYTAYYNPRGFIYQNKDKKNRLIRIDELHRFSDGALNDVRNALDDHLKGINMQYLPQTI